MNNELQHIVANLETVFGKKKAKKILKQIEELKRKNPNQAYCFIFDEQGNFKAEKKN
jgi:hypothetical protein